MTSFGSSARIASAKEKITNAVLGILILLASYLVLNTINPDLVKGKLTLPGRKGGVGPSIPGRPPSLPANGQPSGGGGQPPVITLGGKDFSIREMDAKGLGVIASDPENDRLTYNWVIESDETGKVVFVDKGLNSTSLGIQQGSPTTSGITSVFDGKKVVVRANVTDGVNTVSTKWTITVEGYNRPPVHVFDDFRLLGTKDSPLKPGGGIAPPNAEKSLDPDGTPVSMQWTFGEKRGGTYKGTAVCTGCNGPNPSFSIPEMTAPIEQDILLVSVDGLHTVITKFTAFLSP